MNRMFKRSILFIILAAVVFAAMPAVPWEEVRITVKAGKRQQFKGFGAMYLPHDFYTDNWLSEEDRESIMKFLFQECDFRYMCYQPDYWGELISPMHSWCRLWTTPRNYNCIGTQENDYCIHSQQMEALHDFIGAAKEYQSDFTLISRCGYYYSSATETAFRSWAKGYVHIIRTMKDQYDIHPSYTTMANEPGVSMCGPELYPPHMPQLVNAFREELDNQGLEKIKIMGPESCGADQNARDKVKAILGDPRAHDALEAFSSHSYNWSVTDEMEEIVEKYIISGEKEYWQTEGSVGPCKPEFAENAELASDCIAKTLADLNHLVQVWLYHHVVDEVNADWIVSEGNSCNGWNFILVRPDYQDYLILLKGYYYKQLSRTIQAGSVCRKSIAHVSEVNNDKYWRREDSTMVFAYGDKAPLYLAAAVNPDGSWGIGVTNYTGFERNPYSNPRPKMNYRVKVKVEELVDSGDIVFNVHRCNAERGNGSDDYIHPEGTVTMHDGEVTIDSLGQYDLITLRSSANVAIRPSQRKTDNQNNSLSIEQTGVSSNIVFRLQVTNRQNEALTPIRIYDLYGKEIKSLVTKNISPSEYSITWDRTGNDGRLISAGIYVAKFSIGSNTRIKNFILN